MKSLLIVANFKSNMTLSEAKNWLESFSTIKPQLENFPDKKVILCPSFTLLETFNEFVKKENLPVELGAQNISRLPQGPYTGEVNGAQIKDFANYVIVGHSERRQFGEDESVVEEKIRISTDYGLTPILCVQGENNKIPTEVSIIAYEPIFAIGSGNSDTPEDAQKKAEILKQGHNFEHILYGGSVTGDNVKRFTDMEDISGVLVGTDSLDAEKFHKVIENA